MNLIDLPECILETILEIKLYMTLIKGKHYRRSFLPVLHSCKLLNRIAKPFLAYYVNSACVPSQIDLHQIRYIELNYTSFSPSLYERENSFLFQNAVRTRYLYLNLQLESSIPPLPSFLDQHNFLALRHLIVSLWEVTGLCPI